MRPAGTARRAGQAATTRATHPRAAFRACLALPNLTSPRPSAFAFAMTSLSQFKELCSAWHEARRTGRWEASSNIVGTLLSL